MNETSTNTITNNTNTFVGGIPFYRNIREIIDNQNLEHNDERQTNTSLIYEGSVLVRTLLILHISLFHLVNYVLYRRGSLKVTIIIEKR